MMSRAGHLPVRLRLFTLQSFCLSLSVYFFLPSRSNETERERQKDEYIEFLANSRTWSMYSPLLLRADICRHQMTQFLEGIANRFGIVSGRLFQDLAEIDFKLSLLRANSQLHR